MQRKNWGFTANHLTVMFVAAMVAIAPGQLRAVASYQKVAIQDPQSGKKSRIDSQRRLRVYDESGAADELPQNFVRFFDNSLSTTYEEIIVPPAGKALVIKSIAVDVYRQDALGTANVRFYLGTDSIKYSVATVDSGIGTTQLNLEPGLVVPAGQSLWAVATTPDIDARIFGTGYAVPAAWAAALASSEVGPSPRTAEARQ